jgi:hypothetical protein
MGSGASEASGSGSGKEKIQSRDEYPGSYFPELKTIFRLRIFKFFVVIRIWDPAPFRPGNGMEKFGSGINIRIRNTERYYIIKKQRL